MGSRSRASRPYLTRHCFAAGLSDWISGRVLAAMEAGRASSNLNTSGRAAGALNLAASGRTGSGRPRVVASGKFRGQGPLRDLATPVMRTQRGP